MSRPKVIFTLDREIIDELDRTAKELKEKKSRIVEKALILYFDLLDVKIADKRLAEAKRGKSKLVPAEDVYKDLGL